MIKLLAIVGPTSSGKTSLAIDLAKRFDGELISADSRQVYKRLNVGTGKDIPFNAKFNFVSKRLGGYYLIDGVRVWGYDLVKPDIDFSVTDYIRYSRNIIRYVVQQDKLPILVGGTGFYIQGVIDGIETARVPRNENLRRSLSAFSAEELFERLANIAPEKAGNMNVSDKKNPRRLIRAIEVAQWKMKITEKIGIKPLQADTLFIGIKVNKINLEKRIKDRIYSRLETGFDEEVKELMMSGVGWDNQSMQALGYRQWKDYLMGKIEKKDAIKDWLNAEKKYAKKQMIWFRRDKRIIWFDQTRKNWQQEMVQYIKNWVDR